MGDERSAYLAGSSVAHGPHWRVFLSYALARQVARGGLI